MNAVGKRSLGRSRRIVLCLLSAAALALTFTPPASAQTIDLGGSATGTGSFGFTGFTLTRFTLTLAVTGTPLTATGPVTYTDALVANNNFTGVARCIAIDETGTGFRASISGEITGGRNFILGFRGFRVTVYDNTPPPSEIDQVGHVAVFVEPRTTCDFDIPPEFTVSSGDYTITPARGCPPNGDDDNDGLTNNNESLFSTLLGNADSDFDGIADGNDDANGNGEDDEDEDDDEDDGCPDEDSDDDGEDDEDEDDDEDDDD